MKERALLLVACGWATGVLTVPFEAVHFFFSVLWNVQVK